MKDFIETLLGSGLAFLGSLVLVNFELKKHRTEKAKEDLNKNLNILKFFRDRLEESQKEFGDQWKSYCEYYVM